MNLFFYTSFQYIYLFFFYRKVILEVFIYYIAYFLILSVSHCALIKSFFLYFRGLGDYQNGFVYLTKSYAISNGGIGLVSSRAGNPPSFGGGFGFLLSESAKKKRIWISNSYILRIVDSSNILNDLLSIKK